MGGDKRRWHKITLVVPPPWKEVLPHFLEEMGFSGLWLDEEQQPPHRLILRAYLQEGLWQPDMQEQLRAHLKELSSIFPDSRQEPELHVGLIDEEDWASKWLPFFQPFKIGSVWFGHQHASKRLSLILVRPLEPVITNPHSSAWNLYCCFAHSWKMGHLFLTWAQGAASLPCSPPK